MESPDQILKKRRLDHVKEEARNDQVQGRLPRAHRREPRRHRGKTGGLDPGAPGTPHKPGEGHGRLQLPFQVRDRRG